MVKNTELGPTTDDVQDYELPIVLLPMDGARQLRTYTFESMNVELREDLLASYSGNVRDEQRRNAFFLAVYASLLYRFSGGETDIAVGVSMPDKGEFYMLISLEKDRSFRTILKRVLEQLERPGYQYGDSMANTGFIIDGKPDSNTEQPLSWLLLGESQEVRLQAHYDTSLFKESTIRRYIDAYSKIVEAALTDETVNIETIDLLSAEEYALYDKLNDTDLDYPVDLTIHQFIENVVRQYPDRKAVSSAENAYTYRTLNEQANRVAHLLLSKGIRKGDLVTIFMERSTDTIVSLLGILKAGGAYVPVDPEYPEERISYILEDTRAGYILTKQSHLKRAEQLGEKLGTVKHVVAVDSAENLEAYSASNPEQDIAPDDLAYVIYTSGSTGRPKGALLAHQGVVNLGVFSRKEFEITERDIVTQFASFSFDASVSEMICALFSGAHLHLLSAEERVSVDAFVSVLERTKTTFIPFVPTVFFNQLASVLSEEDFRRLHRVRTIMTAGEALYGEQVRVFQKKTDGRITVYNLYGPTECTVGTTYYRIPSPVRDGLTHVPIGLPNSNYKVYVVNEAMQLCPANVPGELLVESVGLSRGYLGKPDKTAEVFVPSPFKPGTKVYRTGDIVKLLEDGTLEYVTRRDTQVKIRGHRIEIGAVEDVMSKYPNIQETAVVAVKEPNGQLALVGYYTSKDGNRLSSSELRVFLKEKLPAYYVPKWLSRLDKMPLSPTGKVDRKKLAAYELSSIEEEEQSLADPSMRPHTEVQKRISHAWKEALGKEAASIEDDFFRIGGDSLAAIQVLVSLKPQCPALETQHLYQYRTIGQLAGWMEQLAEQGQAASGVGAARDGSIKLLREYPRMLGSTISNAEHSEPACILLTGATGYLGSHILYELLKKSQARIAALVRRSHEQSAVDRLWDVMRTYFGDSLLFLMNERVTVVEGDLEIPGLGLSPQDKEMLYSQIDTVVHAAADVRHLGDEEQIFKSNVDATRHLLELAQSRPGVRFHHISTIGVPEQLALDGKWESVEQSGAIDANLNVDNVYTNSKLEAEKLVFAAASQGLAVSVYRPGNIACHSLSGKFQTNIESNAFYRMIKGMLLLGKAPEISCYIDVTPVDYASSTITDLMLNQEAVGRVFHICNPNPITYMELIEMINKCGYSVETMEFGKYVQWLFDPAIAKSQEALELAMAMLEGDGARDSEYIYDCETTISLLEPTSLRCAYTDLSFIHKLIACANYVGYFPQPQQSLPTALALTAAAAQAAQERL
ncbi:peptide synthetase [Paenibacillus sp. CCS19]|uniref:non-ribosomal peptide synthetase family protein n=1 Tax=Paenibacillus sp. CCS19 TaxID=3158387 RepID=UPI00256A988A|nr:non-ribosomal peptide synthetase [Paenibacillus cellulosilyticus]GMK37681.1 peptide synthetase [Paenibacillus cellulosilyticus]